MEQLCILTLLFFGLVGGNHFGVEEAQSVRSLINKSYIEKLVSEHHKNPKEVYEDWFFDLERDEKTINLEVLIKMAISDGISLDDLSRFGLVKVSGGAYELDINEHLSWLTISDIVTAAALHASSEEGSELLLDMGMSKSDLNEIFNYLKEKKLSVERAKSTLNFIQTAKHYKNKIATVEDQETYYHQLVYTSTKMQKKAEQEWALVLVNKLSEHSRRVLFEASLRISKNRRFIPDKTARRDKVYRFYSAIFSEKIEEDLNLQIKQLEKEI